MRKERNGGGGETRRKERDFIRENLSTIVCVTSAYGDCCPQAQAFSTMTVGNCGFSESGYD